MIEMILAGRIVPLLLEEDSFRLRSMDQQRKESLK